MPSNSLWPSGCVPGSSLCAVPSYAADAPRFPTFPLEPTAVETPKGYNVNDFQKLLAFLEIADADGVKNGTKLSSAETPYSPEDPTTWGSDVFVTLEWRDFDGEKRLVTFNADGMKLFGELDLSGCSCLERLSVAYNSLSKINCANASAMITLFCQENQLTELNLDGCSWPRWYLVLHEQAYRPGCVRLPGAYADLRL